MAMFDAGQGKRTERQLDVQLTYGVDLRITNGGKAKMVPLVGGGGEFNVTLGHKGEVIGYSEVWRPIEKVEVMSTVIPKEAADKQFGVQLKIMEKGDGNLY